MTEETTVAPFICPECGRMTGGPDDEIPYGDPPDYAPDLDGDRDV